MVPELPGDPEPSGGELESDRPAARRTEEPWWGLDHPVWQHWGTKAGLVVGACLLLLALYQFTGNKDDGDSPAGKDGPIATNAQTNEAAPAPKRGKPPAARQAVKPNRPGVAKGGPAAKKPAPGKAQPIAKGPQPGKPSDSPKVAGPPKMSPAAGTPAANPAKQLADGAEPLLPANAPAAKTGLAGQPLDGQAPAAAGPGVPLPGPNTAFEGTLPTNPPGLAGTPVGGNPGLPPAPERSSSFLGRRPDGTVDPSQATNPTGPPQDPMHTVSHGPGFNPPPADLPRQSGFPRTDPALAGGSRYPKTGTPRESYAWPARDAAPVARSGYQRPVENSRTSGFGGVPASMQSPYPTTDHPHETYLRRRTAADDPVYRTGSRDSAGVRSYDGTYPPAMQPGTARLQGTIESSPIRSSHELR
jgi:hypothetical protein